jgi:hypothetical protein
MADYDSPSGAHELFHRTEQTYFTIRTGIRATAWAVSAYFGFGAIGQFAGQSTDEYLALSLVLNALVEIKFVVAIALAGAACAWGVVERSLRHRKVERLQGRIRQLETKIDPNRSTSGLAPMGKTNPKDRRR